MKSHYPDISIIKATSFNSNLDAIVDCIDAVLPAEGYGFVNKMQIQTQLHRGNIWIAKDGRDIVGVRVGKLTLWNLVVKKEYRGLGIGKMLIEICLPDTIRVKNEPIGHLSKQQKDNFISPIPFYEKMGYVFWGKDFGRNLWQRSKNTVQFQAKGNVAHISVFKRAQRLLFE